MNRPLFIFFIVLTFQSFGQSSKTIDSTKVFNLLTKANYYYSEASYDSAIYYSNKAKLLSEQKNYKQGMAYAHIKKAEIYIDQDFFDKANEEIKHTQALAIQIKDSLVLAIADMQEAQVYMYQNNINEALQLFKKCTDGYFSKHPSEYAALAYNDFGYAYGLRGQLAEKTDCLFKALEIYENLPQLNHGEIAVTYNNLSTVYYELNQMEKAIEYAKKAIEHRKLSGEIDRLALSYCNLSQMYRSIDREASEKYQKLCVEYAEKSKNQDRIIHAYITSALLASDSNNREKAIEFEKKAIAILEQNQNNLNMLAKRYLALGMHYKALNEDANATYAYLNKALTISKKVHDKGVISETYSQLSDYFSKHNNYKEALEAKKKYYVYRDSIIQENTNSTIADLETKYETTKKEKEINALTAKNKISEQQKKTQSFLFLGVITLVGVASLFLFLAYRNKLKTAQKLKELDGLKSRFFANISHEFRTPLTLIKSPLQLLQEQENNASNKKHLQLIEQHSDRMLGLVNQLLQLSKIDAGHLKLLLQKSNMSAFLNVLVEPYEFQAKETGLIFSKNIEKTAEDYWFDKDVLEKITTNLLSNALKYTTEKHKVIFDAKVNGNQLQLHVSNHTETLKKEQVPKLFERFYQQKESQQGVGIGLALVKELVTLYKGSINAALEQNILTFSVVLPLDKDLLKDVSVISELPDAIIIDATTYENDSELPILLVVDDYAEVRLVLKELFKNNFQILEAANGNEALKLAMQNIPDIIISDVNMPNMDGFKLTEKLKNHELTSFIPIILLTTQSSEIKHLKGLQYEADDYITKPFSHKILKTKVQQLIETRRKLRDRYSKELILKPKDIAINTLDEKFMERLQLVVDNHLSNSDFLIDDFAKNMGLSRMQLHRKLKTLLGVSATEFLRNERLKSAAILLKKGGTNISEIAYSVGFNDISYFSKCFKEMYGVTPTEYGFLS
jgi:signal transduction histidine kinase/CheY-like chemotaxis protein/AraC-like DNA-binding protein